MSLRGASAASSARAGGAARKAEATLEILKKSKKKALSVCACRRE